MTALGSIDPVRDVDFVAEASPSRGELAISLTGTADLNVKPALDRFLTDVHTRACALGVKEVVVDLRSLEFMNSSCLKSLVMWINNVQTAERPYHIAFISNVSAAWQRRSLSALACMAGDIVTVQA